MNLKFGTLSSCIMFVELDINNASLVNYNY